MVSIRDVSFTIPNELRIVINLLNLYSLPNGDPYSIVGGYIRDLILDGNPRDIDICYYERSLLDSYIIRNNQIRYEQVRNKTIQYLLFHGIEIPIDWVPCNTLLPYPPRFDFTINEVALFPDGRLIACPQTWLDLETRILRLREEKNPTTNIVLRACRFIVTCNLKPCNSTVKAIKEAMVNKKLNQITLTNQLQNAENTGILYEVFELMRFFNIPINGFKSGISLLEYLLDKERNSHLDIGDEEYNEIY